MPTVFANRAFNPTSNRRNEAMFKEATEFAQSLRTIDKDMKTLLKGIDGAQCISGPALALLMAVVRGQVHLVHPGAPNQFGLQQLCQTCNNDSLYRHAGHFKNLRNILVSPLPRPFDEGPMGVHPLDLEPHTLGADMEVWPP
jgi:hypothetical protein